MTPLISDDPALPPLPAVSAASIRAAATAELLTAAAAEQEAGGDAEWLQSLRRALCAAELFVLVCDTTDSATPEVVYVDREGLRWLPAFSSVEALSAWMVTIGGGDEQISSRSIRGTELLSDVLPCLPVGTGVVLDPLQPHARALPTQSLVTSVAGSPSAAPYNAPTKGRHRWLTAPTHKEKTVPQPEPALVVAAQRCHAGEPISPEALTDLFRDADVYFERLPGLALPTAEYEGAAWVPVFSTPERLAAFVATRDGRSDGEVSYVRLSGARLLDVYVTNLAEPAGIVLDPLDEHVLLAPAAQPTTD